MRNKQIILGFVIGLLTAIIGIVLFDVIIGLYNGDAIPEILDRTLSTKFLGKRASIGALLNLPVFYFFLNRKNEDKARGVLMATAVIAIVFIVNKF